MPEPQSLTAQESSNGPPTPLILHAEYLPNIRQVSVQISISGRRSDSTDGTESQPEISLSESRRAVSVSFTSNEHGFVSETIKLPARVTEGSRRMLSISGARNSSTANGNTNKQERSENEYSYRMQIDESEITRLRQDSLDEHLESFVPWSAGDMAPSTKLACKQCGQVILDEPAPPDTPKSEPAGWIWKDLPSGNWAEMMDFWHCHKPDPEPGDAGHGAEDESSLVKGYGASNQVLAAKETVLVDVATFLVSDAECRGVNKTSKQPDDHLPSEDELVCENCDSLIGVADFIAQGWRLFKTSLSANFASEESPEQTTWETHPTELVVAAQLLELIERESARRFIIHCGETDGLLIWVFNPDMRYSNTSSQHSVSWQRAMKVFFQSIADVEAMLHPEPGKTSSLSLEELRLPVSTYDSLLDALEESNRMLPQSARTFQQSWRVGILNRFEKKRLYS